MVLLGDVAPNATLILQATAWLALVTTVSMLLALGVSSLLGSRGTSIAVLLGWWLVAMPLLVGTARSRNLLLTAPLGRLQPAILRDNDLTMTLPMAVVVLMAWTVAPLALGAWRTCTPRRLTPLGSPEMARTEPLAIVQPFANRHRESRQPQATSGALT